MHGRIAWLAAIVAAGLALPAGASAGEVVYSVSPATGGDQLWVMGEDGSNQRPWLDAFDDLPESGGTKFVTVFTPEISPDGRRVTFTAETLANKPPGSPWLGLNAQGVYLWEAGVARRLSGPPAPGDRISTFESDAAPAADGRIYHSLSGGSYTASGAFASAFGDVRVLAPDGSDAPFGPACDSIGLGASGGPKPSPVDPGLVVYAGCDEAGEETVRVSRADRVEERIVRTAPPSPDGYASEVSDPAWLPDGGRIVSVERPGAGADRIVTYAPDGSDARTVLTAPQGTQLDAPHYVGTDRIVFGTYAEGAGSDISIVDASCADCALGAARALTSGGTSRSPSWSAAGLVQPAPPPGTPDGPTPTTPTTPTTSTTTTTTATSPPISPPLDPSVPPAGNAGIDEEQDLALQRIAARRGLAVRVTLSRPGTVRLALTGTRPKRKAVRTRRGLESGATTIRLTRIGGRRIRRGTYRLTVVTPNVDGNDVTARITLRVRR